MSGLPPVEENGVIYDAILIQVDRGLTGGVIFLPCNKEIDAETTGNLILDTTFRRFGIPKRIISNRGPNFAAKSHRQLLRRLGIDSRLSTAYHPQTDGLSERGLQEVQTFLGIYCINHPETWKDHLPILEFTWNNRRHADNEKTPFELIMGLQPQGIPKAFETSNIPSVTERMENLTMARREALAAHELARQQMIQQSQNEVKPFQLGEKVWLEAKNLNRRYLSNKIRPRREGPFEITQVIGPVSYRLKLPTQWKIHDVFHMIWLSPYKETELHGPNHTTPPPDLINQEEEYEVEAILNHKRKGRGFLYLVQWKGYPISEASWEPKGHLTNATQILEEYKQRHNIPLTL